jgi:tetratricopeptide (TPR) repeat protein
VADSSSPYEDRVSRWPYAIRPLFQTPNARLIESHAVAHACRSLNIGRLTAFAGSGASMAYGRISWSDMIYVTQMAVLGRFADWGARIKKDKSEFKEIEPVFEQIERISLLLQRHKIERSGSLTIVQQLTIFQMAEEADQAITRALNTIDPGLTKNKSKFRDTIMWLTRDDRGHAEQLLKDALLDRDLPTVRQSDGHDELQNEQIEAFVENELWGGSDVPTQDRKLPKINGQVEYAEYLTKPMQRYRLAAHLTELSEPARHEVVAKIAAVDPDPQRAKGGVKERQRESKRRSDTVEPSRDPLLITLRDLKINRFLTTNYDHEIERLFRDQGFRDSQAGGAPSVTSKLSGEPLADSFRDVVFTHETTGDLAALAASDRSRSGWVVHLHGRAEVDGKGEIIATEEDYRARYARPDDTRPLVDDAIRLAFGASPILFLGIGMDEMDLLRPLRQFMSTPTRIGDRVVIALLPKLKDEKKTELQKIDLLQRFGVYSIHFGNAAAPRKEEKILSDNELLKIHRAWLPAISGLKEAIDEALRPFNDAKEFEAILQDNDKWVDFRESVHSKATAIGKICAGLAKIEDPKSPRSPIDDKDNKLVVNTPGGWVFSPPTYIEGRKLDSFLKVDREVEDVNTALDYFFQLSRLVRAQDSAPIAAAPTVGKAAQAKLDEKNSRILMKWAERRRTGQAHKVLLSGALNGIITVSLCARLKRLKSEWDMWREQWYRLQKARPPSLRGMEHVSLTLPDGRPVRIKLLRRHAINLPDEPDRKENRTKRFYAGAPSQTFNSLMSALQNESRKISSIEDRRTFIFIARRGIGKGHFFAAMQQATPDGRLAKFLSIVMPGKRGSKGRTSEYSVAFFNVSFSLEATSIFDRISLLLWDFLPKKSALEEDNWEGLRHDRLARLRFVLNLCRRHRPPGGPTRRVLLAFNGINVFFDRVGKPKNRQFKMLFDILLDVDFAEAPIDLFFVCDETAVPEQFRKKRDKDDNLVPVRRDLAMRLLKRKDISAKDQVALEQRIDAIRLAVSKDEEKTNHFAHFLHHARASVVATSYFPSVAVMLARHTLNGSRSKAAKELKGWITSQKKKRDPFARRPNVFRPRVAQQIRVLLKELLGTPTPGNWLAENERVVFPKIMIAAAVGVEIGHTDLHAIGKALKAETKKILSPKAFHDFIVKVTGASAVSEQLHAVSGEVDDVLRRVAGAVGGRRFVLTLLFAMTYEILFQKIRTSNDKNKLITAAQYDALVLESDNAIEFLLAVCREVDELRSPRRADVVIARILARMKQRHESSQTKEELRLPVRVDGKGTGNDVELETGLELYNLQQWLLWHFAVIGLPIESDVLARCPLIRKAINDARRLPKDNEASKSRLLTDREYEKCVEAVLRLLVNRCLVFELRDSEPPLQPRDLDASAQRRPRYSIHRTLQRHIFQKMGAPFVDYAEVDRFSLSLYASQPNDIPRLSPDSHEQLRRTVWALSGYPEDDGVSASYDSIDANFEGQRLRKRMLRAAYGILRSIYSVASVARFDIKHEQIDNTLLTETAPGSPGFFEEHRRQVRWLLYQAVEITKTEHMKKAGDGDEGKERGSGDDEDDENLAPFYAEEIVWLWNECGVLSLTQGRLPDAVALFEMANKAAERIEPEETGPLRTIVLLNRSIAEIERGRMASARATLARIIETTDEESDPEVHLIAHGYSALIRHLTGHSEEAGKTYKSIIDKLIERQKSRAASIFARHYGDLLRAMSIDRHPEARRYLDMSAQLSLEDNHEDTRHLALLAQARLKLMDPAKPRSVEIHAILDGVERYARVMGMPRIASEVDEIRARLHRRNGDLKTAGTVAMNSLEVAALNELRIRKANLLTLLARINLSRGYTKAAQALVDEAVVIIGDTDYHAASKAVQELVHSIRGAPRSGDGAGSN